MNEIRAGWVEKDDLQLTRVRELLAQRGCPVSSTSLQRFVVRQGWRSQDRTTVRMPDTKPGEVAEMDFGRLGLVTEGLRQRLPSSHG